MLGIFYYDEKKMSDIFNIWKASKDIDFKFEQLNHLYLEFGGIYFGHEIEIYKMSDDWFLLTKISRDAYTFARRNNRTYESYRNFYKCDQFDGVLSFLENELNPQQIKMIYLKYKS